MACCTVNRVAIAVGVDVFNLEIHRADCMDVSMDYREGAVKDAKPMEMTSLPVQANTINTINTIYSRRGRDVRRCHSLEAERSTR